VIVPPDPAHRQTSADEDSFLPDRLTPRRLAEVVRQVAGATGLDASGARRITFTNNAVVALPAAGAVVRVAGSGPVRHRVGAVIAAARLYAEHGVPAVRLWPGVDQPLRVGQHLATLWRFAPSDGRAATPEDLARILRSVHAVGGALPTSIPPWSVPDGIRRRIAEADGVDGPTIAYLAQELESIDAALSGLGQVEPLLPAGLVHGDAHLGNIIVTPDGPVICDFDSTAVGRREWDLIPVAVGARRFGCGPDAQTGLARAYGVDITVWPGFDVLRRLRELQLITSVVPVLGANPALRPQWQHRLDTYRSGDLLARWTPYALVR
jgi:hypothetical protein